MNNTPDTIICDLDGTLAINNHGRDYFNAKDCEKDAVNLAVLTVLRWALDDNKTIIFVSGREERFREPTERWLAKFLLHDYDLFMREDKDNRRDHIVKEEIYKKNILPFNNDILFVLDDRNSKKSPVVDMWRKQGLRCFQVAEGNF
jgi:hypothetical protein